MGHVSRCQRRGNVWQRGPAATTRRICASCVPISMRCAWNGWRRSPRPVRRRSWRAPPAAFAVLPARRLGTGPCEGSPATTRAGTRAAARSAARAATRPERRARVPAGAHSRSAAALRRDDVTGVSRGNVPAFSVQPAALLRRPRLRLGRRTRWLPTARLAANDPRRTGGGALPHRPARSGLPHGAQCPGAVPGPAVRSRSVTARGRSARHPNRSGHPASCRSDDEHQPGSPSRDAPVVSSRPRIPARRQTACPRGIVCAAAMASTEAPPTGRQEAAQTRAPSRRRFRGASRFACRASRSTASRGGWGIGMRLPRPPGSARRPRPITSVHSVC